MRKTLRENGPGIEWWGTLTGLIPPGGNFGLTCFPGSGLSITYDGENLYAFDSRSPKYDAYEVHRVIASANEVLEEDLADLAEKDLTRYDSILDMKVTHIERVMITWRLKNG